MYVRWCTAIASVFSTTCMYSTVLCQPINTHVYVQSSKYSVSFPVLPDSPFLNYCCSTQICRNQLPFQLLTFIFSLFSRHLKQWSCTFWHSWVAHIVTCVGYAEARNSYRLDVRFRHAFLLTVKCFASSQATQCFLNLYVWYQSSSWATGFLVCCIHFPEYSLCLNPVVIHSQHV